MSLTHGRVRDLLDYDPETGAFCWRVARRSAPVGKRAGSFWTEPASGRVYVQIGLDRRKYLAHRLAWFYMTGEWPAAYVDHIDGNSTNNRWSNLRSANHQQNLANARLSKANRTGFKGVSQPRGSDKRYFARIKVHRKQIWLGYFDTPEGAHRAYCAAATKHFGEFARFE